MRFLVESRSENEVISCYGNREKAIAKLGMCGFLESKPTEDLFPGPRILVTSYPIKPGIGLEDGVRIHRLQFSGLGVEEEMKIHWVFAP